MTEEKAKLEQAIARGLNAKAVLDNPVYREALLSIRGELMAQFERTKYKDSDDRDEIWRKVQTVNWFEAHIERVMKHGSVAEKTLMQMAKEKVHNLFRSAR